MILALGTHDRFEASLLVDGKYRKNGDLTFDVINGQWDGKLTSDGILTVTETGYTFPAVIVWAKPIPPNLGDYNGILNWINEQL